MDLFRIRRERIQPACDTVIKTRADADHHITIMHRHIRFVSTMHPEHTEPLRISRGIRAQAHQGRGNREARQTHQFPQQSRGFIARIDHTAAGIEHRLLRTRHQCNGRADLFTIAIHLRTIGLVLVALRALILAKRKLHILRNIHHHRARTAIGSNIKRLMQHTR